MATVFSSDASTGIDTRWISSQKAIAFLGTSAWRWLFGVGTISPIDPAGLMTWFSHFFFLADITWLGVVFEFGLLGAALILGIAVRALLLLARARKLEGGGFFLGALSDYLIYAVLISPFIKPGTVTDTPYNHYSLLRTTEAAFGLTEFVGHAADLGQRVHDAVHGFLVAGDERGRQDDQVVGGDRDAAVLAARHPRQRRHRFALGAGGDQYHLLGRHLLGDGDVDDVAVFDMQEAQFLGDAHVADHRPADEGHPPAQCHRGVDDLLHPVDVGGEAGDDHPPAIGAPHQPVQGRPDLALRGPHAGDLGVRGVAQEQVHSGVAEARHSRQVGRAAVQWKLVEFDVAGV